MHVHRHPLNPPQHHLLERYPRVPAATDQKGAMLLSGYSPRALMKFILSGAMEEEHVT